MGIRLFERPHIAVMTRECEGAAGAAFSIVIAANAERGQRHPTIVMAREVMALVTAAHSVVMARSPAGHDNLC